MFGFAAVAYILLTVSYSLLLKHVVIIDVMALSAGFLIRAIAGATVIAAPISQWLLLCTGLLALFLSIGKRRGELVAVLGGRKSGRGVIGEYSIELLDQMSTIVTSALVMSYALYTIQSEAAAKHPYLRVTLPFVLFGIFRYLYLIHRKNKGESPDEVVLRDHQLIICVLFWGIATAAVILNKI
jgi:4-hydroxybenzoate polyprenyltransferase